MSSILIIARKEFRDDFRNRWTIAVAVLFAVLALSISYFGGAAAGKLGFTSFDATLASLTTLAAFVIPLIGLLIAYDMVVGEQDNGNSSFAIGSIVASAWPPWYLAPSLLRRGRRR